MIGRIFWRDQKDGMTRMTELVRRVIARNPAGVAIPLALIILGVDFVMGREIRFPLLYLIPIALVAWQGKKTLAYSLSLLLPSVRVVFENFWGTPETMPTQSINTAFEVLGFCLYVYLLCKHAEHTRQMRITITAQQDGMQHLRAFARMTGSTLKGRGISPGLADGTAILYEPDLHATPSVEHISAKAVELEIQRFDRALSASLNELNDLRKQLEVADAHQEIALVEAHAAMLSDPSFVRQCKRRMSENLVMAETAVTAEIRDIEQKFQGLEHEFMRARAADVRDVGLQILSKLGTSGEAKPHRLASLPAGSVIVAEEILLTDALQMDTTNVVAIVTEKTGPASHVAMLARSRGIPAVCDIGGATTLVSSGDYLLVDAEAGMVTVGPTPTQARRFTLLKSQSVPVVRATSQEPKLPCVTKDGVEIALHANIGRADEAVIVLERGLDGVGLFRSEYLFLGRNQPPDLETQSAAYAEVAAKLDPLPVVIRTMDFGGDKMPHFVSTARDPAFRAGLRGLAYSLAEKKMFRTQITAIVRAAKSGNVRMMFPMVLGSEDLRKARSLVDEVLQLEFPNKRLFIGAMIETPAAAFDIHGILDLADFVSIGTNDLAHYILAVDRWSRGDLAVLSFFHPSVLRATCQVTQVAGDKGVGLSVCGEAASDPAAACLLIGMGVRTLSINPFLAPRVRRAIQQVTLEQMQAVAQDIQSAKTDKRIRELLAPVLREIAA